MKPCECRDFHPHKRIVVTGGPGAGKTAVLELIRQSFCEHVAVMPEAAGILFSGGFPRDTREESRRAVQRAIFYVQRELELATTASDAAIILCDRGTVDGIAYWPGPNDFWSAVGTTLETQLQRYDVVIHMRTPQQGYNHQNPLRTETADEAFAIDTRIALAWESHPRRFVIEPAADFLTKAAQAIRILREEMPSCCRAHMIPSIDLPEQSSQSKPTDIWRAE